MRRPTVAAVAALVLLAGCARGGETADAAELIAAAPEATAQDGTALIAMTIRATGGAQDTSIAAEGAVNFAEETMTMTMDFGEQMAQAGISQMEMRSIGTTLYMKVPNGKQLGMQTPWMKMDLEELTGAQGLGGLQQLNNDPSNSLQMLRGVSEDITEVGTETVRDTETTHYRATVDMDKAVEQAPERARTYLRQQFETAGVTTLPVDVWIDAEGRLRRQSFTMDLSKVAGGGGNGAPTEMTMDMELFDFGAPVEVTAPPKKKVTDFAKLQGGGGN